MDGFPSGQRGQTVNLLQLASVVRIHLHPLVLEKEQHSIISRGGAVWKLVGLITGRSWVRVPEGPFHYFLAQWLSWLERRPVTAEVVSSSLIWVVYGVLAQLGEHLPYKQRVIGSSPIGPIFSI